MGTKLRHKRYYVVMQSSRADNLFVCFHIPSRIYPPSTAAAADTPLAKHESLQMPQDDEAGGRRLHTEIRERKKKLRVYENYRIHNRLYPYVICWPSLKDCSKHMGGGNMFATRSRSYVARRETELRDNTQTHQDW